jgi:two-component system sensor histidine kinase UhpB
MIAVVFYVIFAVLWVVISDRAVRDFQQGHLQTIKALLFVSATACFFFIILRRSFCRRDAALAAAHEACQRFELVARAANDAMWDWNLITDEIWWSVGFENLFGYPLEELEPTIDSWIKRLHPDDKDRTVTYIHRVIDSGRRTWSDEYRFRRKDGSYAQVFDRGFVVHDATGKAVRMVGGMTDITDRKLAEAKLDMAHRQMRALSARLQSTREEERTHIAREIHDELGQMLTALRMDLSWIEKKFSELEGNERRFNSILEKLVEASDLTDQTIRCLQNIAAELRPGALDSLGLATAIKQEASRFQERAGISCHVGVPEGAIDVKAEVATAIFRIYQEALTNVARHSKATELRIQLSREQDHIVLMVRDNGKGISQADLENPRSLGLVGMRERALLLNSEISFERASEGGTVVTLRVPESANDTKFWELV